MDRTAYLRMHSDQLSQAYRFFRCTECEGSEIITFLKNRYMFGQILKFLE
jgi:hypothetical protein